MRVQLSAPREAGTSGGLTTTYEGCDRVSKRICSFPECGKPHASRGVCSGHYYQLSVGSPLTALKPQGTGTPSERFWSKVDKTDDCWLWTAGLAGNGYASFSLHGRSVMGHRFAYEEAYGAIPKGMVLDHTCWTLACVRPDHMRVVTNQQNLQNRKSAPKNSSTGIRGVRLRNGKWNVYGSTKGKQIWVGSFPTAKEAEAAAIAFRREHMPYSLKDRLPKSEQEAA